MEEQQLPPHIAQQELKQLLQQDQDNVIIIDVRSGEEYDRQHIPGALNIPVGELQARQGELPSNKQIVTVCNAGGGRCKRAATLLQEEGFTKVNFLEGGTVGWYGGNPDDIAHHQH